MEQGKVKTVLGVIAIGLAGLIVFGLIWFFFIGSSSPVGAGWYLFSFAAGLTMIVLPCTLPLAFVIVPLSMGKGPAKGIGIALFFGLGVALTLSIYGVIAAIVGEVAIGSFGAPLETVKNWLYFVAGAFAYLFALGELGLVKFRMPSYSGAAPAFIQKQQDYLKALLLGIFLGNVGVGCPHPATPVILTRIAASGDVFYGWLLFFVHAIGRVLPLLLLALLAILGVNALSWLVERKEKLERATGWGMVFVAAFILVLGLFTHDWWVYSGQHTLLESVTQEERFLGAVSERIGAEAPHAHEIPTGTGIFDLPLWLGNWVLVFLWVLPMWWYYFRLRSRDEKLKIEQPASEEFKIESHVMPYRLGLLITLTILLAIVFIQILPDRFLRSSSAHGNSTQMMESMGMDHIDHGSTIFHEASKVREGLSVNLNITPVPVLAGFPERLDFFVEEKPEGNPVLAEELEIEQEKIMHVIGVRSDMNEFLHIHPMPGTEAGILTTEYTFANPGIYKLWSEIKKDGVAHVFAHEAIGVEGSGLPDEKAVNFERSTTVGNYQVFLETDEPIAEGKEVDLSFDIHTLAGEEVEVEPYLGVEMHLSIIKEDWSQFIHTHPEEMNSHTGEGIVKEAFADMGHGQGGDGTINFHAIFPETGRYKLFAQFRPKDVDLSPDYALLATFWVEVKETPAISGWWTNLLASIVLMTLLSWGVNKFLRPRI